jgi:hypothetical protein
MQTVGQLCQRLRSHHFIQSARQYFQHDSAALIVDSQGQE